MNDDRAGVEPVLLAGWLRARSMARGLPLPVAEGDGWRVETASPDETRRYVFAAASPALDDLARSISAPRIFLKLCGSNAQLQAHLTPAWRIVEPENCVMTAGEPPDQSAPPPSGYRLEIDATNAALSVRIFDPAGALAASGYAAEADGVFAYDRIVTDPAHRRRGLGRAVMTALGQARRSDASRQVLVATAAGRSLYETMGWRVICPYATAVIPTLPA